MPLSVIVYCQEVAKAAMLGCRLRPPGNGSGHCSLGRKERQSCYHLESRGFYEVLIRDTCKRLYLNFCHLMFALEKLNPVVGHLVEDVK